MNNAQKEITREMVGLFSQELQKGLRGLLNVETTPLSEIVIHDYLKTEKNILVSIFFTGIVYGEFVIAMDEKTAHDCMLHSGLVSDDEHKDYGFLTETLNIAVGSVLKDMGKYFDKVTVTAPRVYFGEIRYPKFTAGKKSLKSPFGTIECHFYYDQMQLDLAVSYQDAMKSLVETNRALFQVNEKLKMQQAQLVQSEKMVSLGMMAAGVAHEINNPLAYVDSNISTLENYSGIVENLLKTHEQLFLSLMKKDSKTVECSVDELVRIHNREDLIKMLSETREIFDETRFGVKRIKEIVSGLKTFSHIDHDVIKEVNLNDEIQNMLKLVANQLKYKCEVVKDFGSIPLVECFPGPINQVFVNLLVNASQAMPKQGGKIKIQTRVLANDEVEVVFEDNGCGISEENICKIFDPFFSTKPVGEGTGLGLSISYSIIKKHNGSIDVRSKLNEGTMFRVRLPVKHRQALNVESDLETV